LITHLLSRLVSFPMCQFALATVPLFCMTGCGATSLHDVALYLLRRLGGSKGNAATSCSFRSHSEPVMAESLKNRGVHICSICAKAQTYSADCLAMTICLLLFSALHTMAGHAGHRWTKCKLAQQTCINGADLECILGSRLKAGFGARSAIRKHSCLYVSTYSAQFSSLRGHKHSNLET